MIEKTRSQDLPLFVPYLVPKILQPLLVSGIELILRHHLDEYSVLELPLAEDEAIADVWVVSDDMFQRERVRLSIMRHFMSPPNVSTTTILRTFSPLERTI